MGQPWSLELDNCMRYDRGTPLSERMFGAARVLMRGFKEGERRKEYNDGRHGKRSIDVTR